MLSLTASCITYSASCKMYPEIITCNDFLLLSFQCAYILIILIYDQVVHAGFLGFRIDSYILFLTRVNSSSLCNFVFWSSLQIIQSGNSCSSITLGFPIWRIHCNSSSSFPFLESLVPFFSTLVPSFLSMLYQFQKFHEFSQICLDILLFCLPMNMVWSSSIFLEAWILPANQNA